MTSMHWHLVLITLIITSVLEKLTLSVVWHEVLIMIESQCRISG